MGMREAARELGQVETLECKYQKLRERRALAHRI
jgi:hypothetical protein